MCPMRVFLVLFSAILACYLAWRNYSKCEELSVLNNEAVEQSEKSASVADNNAPKLQVCLSRLFGCPAPCQQHRQMYGLSVLTYQVNLALWFASTKGRWLWIDLLESFLKLLDVDRHGEWEVFVERHKITRSCGGVEEAVTISVSGLGCRSPPFSHTSERLDFAPYELACMAGSLVRPASAVAKRSISVFVVPQGQQQLHHQVF